jgi:hypothetical protein
MFLGDQRTEHGAGCPIRILDRNVNKDRFTAVYRRPCQLDQPMIELVFELVVLLTDFSGSIIGWLLIEQLRKIDPSILGMANFTLSQLVDPADHFVHGAKS